MKFYTYILELINELTTEEKRIEFSNLLGKMDDQELIELIEKAIFVEDIEHNIEAA